MNLDYENKVEAEVDRELRSLPELMAPPTLVLRVMKAIELRLHLPWYRQSWQMWPMALRVASLVLMLALFGGLCFGSWKLAHTESFLALLQRAGGWFAGFGTIWHAVAALLNASVLAVKQLGIGFIIACGAALALGYGLCVTLGTYYVRIGMTRRQER